MHGSQSLVKLSECVTLLEGEIEAGKKAFEEVLHAEIVARQTQNEKTMNQCKELGEKLSLAVATLQQAIAGVTTQTQDAVDQVRYIVHSGVFLSSFWIGVWVSMDVFTDQKTDL